MKNLLKNIFNYFTNNNESFKDKANETNETNDSEKEAERRCINLLEDFDNNYDSYKNKNKFSSIEDIKDFTEVAIGFAFHKTFNKEFDNNFNKYTIVSKGLKVTHPEDLEITKRHLAQINGEPIDALEFVIIQELFTKPDFKLPNFNTTKLDVIFPNKLTNKLILEKKNKQVKNFTKKEYTELCGQEKAQDALDKLYNYNQKDFENTEEGSKANTPKASFIPKFIHRPEIAVSIQ